MPTKRDLRRQVEQLKQEKGLDLGTLPSVSLAKLLSAEEIESVDHPHLLRLDGELHEKKSLKDMIDKVAKKHDEE